MQINVLEKINSLNFNYAVELTDIKKKNEKRTKDINPFKIKFYDCFSVW